MESDKVKTLQDGENLNNFSASREFLSLAKEDLYCKSFRDGTNFEIWLQNANF